MSRRERLTAIETEASLVDWGAELSDPPVPDQLLVWEPKQFAGGLSYRDQEGWWDGVVDFGGNCLKATRPGSRAVVYETGEGIAGFWDFSGHAARVERTRARFVAAGVYRPIDRTISRARLTNDRRLRDRFKSMVARGHLPPLKGGAILALAASDNITIPKFVRFAPPDWADKPGGTMNVDWVGVEDWGCEHPIQMALYKTTSLWRRLGFTRQPLLETRSRDGTCRYDLVSDREDRCRGEVQSRER